jgi:ribonuclease P protein component
VKKKYSLKGINIFKEVNIKGRKYHGRGVRLTVGRQGVAEHESSDLIKIGLSVNKRFGTAVERNRAKRRVRAVCRELIPSIKGPCRVIIRIEPDMKNNEYKDIRAGIASLFSRTGMYKGD